jgi:excisionase family DNA binding protein
MDKERTALVAAIRALADYVEAAGEKTKPKPAPTTPPPEPSKVLPSPASDRDEYRGPHRHLLDVKEAADALGIGRTTLHTLIKNGQLQTVRIASRVFVPEDAIQLFIRQNTR